MMVIQDGKPWRKMAPSVRKWLSGERTCAVCGEPCSDIYLWLTSDKDDLFAMALCKKEPHDHETFAIAVKRQGSTRAL